jgi:hypothetical protein
MSARSSVIIAGILALWCLPPCGLAKSAFGQLGFQMQQWSHQQQMNNHAFERTEAANQRSFYRQTDQNRYPSQQRMHGPAQDYYSTQPSLQSLHITVKPGDKVVTIYSSTPVQIGEKKVAQLASGITLSVIQSKGDWVGVQVRQNGEPITGWIHVSRLRRLEN